MSVRQDGEHSTAITTFSRLLQQLFYRVLKTFLKLNRTHNAGVAHRRAEHPTNSLRFSSNGIMGNWNTNSQEIVGKKCTTKLFANGDLRKKRMLRQVFAFGAWYQYFREI